MKALVEVLVRELGGPAKVAFVAVTLLACALLVAAYTFGQPFVSLLLGATCAWSFTAGYVTCEDWR